MRGYRFYAPMSTRHSCDYSQEPAAVLPFFSAGDDHCLDSSKRKPCLPSIVRKKRQGSIVEVLVRGSENLSEKESRHASMLRNRQNISEIHHYKEEKSAVMTPSQVLKAYKQLLDIYEIRELFDYPCIYYLGKIHSGMCNGSHIYEKENGEYNFTVGDHLAFRYEILQLIGKGSFGQVFKCYDHKENEFTAIKVVNNKKLSLQQACAELDILRYIQKHGSEDKFHLIHFKSHFFFRNHICFSFELLSHDLYDYLKLNNFQGLSIDVVQSIVIQVLSALLLLHKHNIIHCDVKPENILLITPEKSAVKLIDFGTACFINHKSYTYMQSRFYRAPEVLFGAGYDCKIDIWSLGCVVFELLMGYPLFAGKNEEDQIRCISNTLGHPPSELLQKASKNASNIKLTTSEQSLKEKVLCEDPNLIDFLTGCLEWNPENRLSSEEALQHAWLQYKY